MSNVLVGVGLTLSIAAFALAMWPVVAEAPWEEQKTVGSQYLSVPQSAKEPSWKSCTPSKAYIAGRFTTLYSKEDCCSYIIGLLAVTETERSASMIYAQGTRYGCWG